MRKETDNRDLIGIMDEGWNETIKKSVEEENKAAAAMPVSVPLVTDPEKKKAAIEAALKQVEESFRKEAETDYDGVKHKRSVEWIFPCNIKLFRHDDALRTLGRVKRDQTKPYRNVKIDDIVYMYESSPVNAICWKCIVTDSHCEISQIDDSQFRIPPYQSGALFEGPFIELKVICEYTVGDRLSYSALKQHGLKSTLTGPERVNEELSNYINSIDLSEESQTSYAESMEMSALKTVAEQYSQRPVRRTVTNQMTFSRNLYIAQYAKRRADGACQLCGEQAPFCDLHGRPYLEVHHIEWLANGGSDSINNTVALCPNCHRKMHIVNDPADVAVLKAAIASD